MLRFQEPPPLRPLHRKTNGTIETIRERLCRAYLDNLRALFDQQDRHASEDHWAAPLPAGEADRQRRLSGRQHDPRAGGHSPSEHTEAMRPQRDAAPTGQESTADIIIETLIAWPFVFGLVGDGINSFIRQRNPTSCWGDEQHVANGPSANSGRRKEQLLICQVD